MALSTVVKNLNDGAITLKDGGAGLAQMTVVAQFTRGDLSVSGLRSSLKDVTAYQARGVLATVRRTARNFPTFSFTALMTQFHDATLPAANATANLVDAIMRAGLWGSAISTLGGSADIYGLSVVLTVEGSNFGDGVDHVATLTDCEMTVDFSEGDPDVITINGTCYGTVSFTAV